MATPAIHRSIERSDAQCAHAVEMAAALPTAERAREHVAVCGDMLAGYSEELSTLAWSRANATTGPEAKAWERLAIDAGRLAVDAQ